MPSRVHRAWSISEREYPAGGTPSEQLRFLLGYAILAPSPQNTQPWRFRLDGERVEVLEDPSRSLDARDPEGRERAIACGGAVYNLRVAIRHFGHGETCEIHPDPAQPELVARVTRGAPREPAPEPRIFEAMRQRRSWRQPFDGRTVPADLVGVMQLLAEGEGARMISVDYPGVQRALAGLVAEADWRLSSDVAVRREAANWIRSRGINRGDGVPGTAMGMGPVESLLAPVTHRVFNYGDTRASRDRSLACEAPLVAALVTPGDSRTDWVMAGQAMQRILLHAVSHGLQTSFLNPPIQVPELRDRLRTLLSLDACPQVLFRAGYPSGTAHPTPRRPLEEVLIQG